MVTGGSNGYDRIDVSEVYDPATDQWRTVGSMATATPSHTATTMQNGRVLIVGGIGPINVAVSRTEVFNPVGLAWLGAPNLSVRRAYHASALLPDGRVLVVGGNNLSGNLDTTEIYSEATGWTAGPNLTTARASATATTLLNGEVLVAGGNHNGSLASAEIYGISDCAITCPADVTFSTGSATATGANVTFDPPTTTGTCGPSVCNPPSGSFFLVGTSPVICTAGFGSDCTFTVTVLNNPPPTITAVEFVKAQGGSKPKLIVRGTGFAAGALVQIDGVGFVAAAQVESPITIGQGGKLTDGRRLKKALPRRQAVTITVTNTDGGTVSVSYTRP
jgi:hypothetical protein